MPAKRFFGDNKSEVQDLGCRTWPHGLDSRSRGKKTQRADNRLRHLQCHTLILGTIAFVILMPDSPKDMCFTGSCAREMMRRPKRHPGPAPVRTCSKIKQDKSECTTARLTGSCMASEVRGRMLPLSSRFRDGRCRSHAIASRSRGFDMNCMSLDSCRFACNRASVVQTGACHLLDKTLHGG